MLPDRRFALRDQAVLGILDGDAERKGRQKVLRRSGLPYSLLQRDEIQCCDYVLGILDGDVERKGRQDSRAGNP